MELLRAFLPHLSGLQICLLYAGCRLVCQLIHNHDNMNLLVKLLCWKEAAMLPLGPPNHAEPCYGLEGCNVIACTDPCGTAMQEHSTVWAVVVAQVGLPLA